MSIRTFILDDEQHCVESLTLDVKKYCPDLKIIQSFTSVKDALKQLKKVEIDLLFLDIEMPWMNGFELLDLLQPFDFEVIFITAYDSYAVKAFRASAIDYLMKPVDHDDLVEAVNKVKSKIASKETQSGDQIQNLLDQYFSNMKNDKISLPDIEGQKFIILSDIIYVEALSNYAKIHMKNGTSHMVSLTLKNIAEKIKDQRFVRVHHSYFINLEHVIQYLKADGGSLVMTNKIQIPISRSRKAALKNIIETQFK